MSEPLDVSRRQFVVLAAACAAACRCGHALAAPTSKPAGKIDIGTPADYAKDGVYDQFASSHQLLIYRENGQIYASTAVCPHKGATLKIKDGHPYCSKHGSVFSAAGTVTKGPAKSALERFAIATDDKGHLIVDTATTFREAKWTDPASFVKAT